MTRPRPTTVLLMLAVAAFITSWLTPVISAADPATVTYRGFRVFWSVVGLLRAHSAVDGWKDGLILTLHIASSLTNGVFVTAVVALLAGWRRALPGLQWLVLIAAVLNFYWFFAMHALRVGYYLWVAAFFLLFGAMARRSAS